MCNFSLEKGPFCTVKIMFANGCGFFKQLFYKKFYNVLLTGGWIFIQIYSVPTYKIIQLLVIYTDSAVKVTETYFTLLGEFP